jgi:hypothetical protein
MKSLLPYDEHDSAMATIDRPIEHWNNSFQFHTMTHWEMSSSPSEIDPLEQRPTTIFYDYPSVKHEQVASVLNTYEDLEVVLDNNFAFVYYCLLDVVD